MITHSRHGSTPDTIAIVDVPHARVVGELEVTNGNTDRIVGLSFTTDGGLVACAVDGEAWRWDAHGSRLPLAIPAHAHPSACIATGDRAIVGTAEGQVLVLDAGGRLRRTIAAHRDGVGALAAQGDWLASAGVQGRVLLHQLDRGAPRVLDPGYARELRVVSPTSVLAAGGNVRVLSLDDAVSPFPWQSEHGFETSAVSNSGLVMLGVDGRGDVRVVRLVTTLDQRVVGGVRH